MNKTRSIVILAISLITVVIVVIQTIRMDEHTAWDIHLEYVSASSVGDAKYTMPTFVGTVMTDYNVTLKNKGDAVTYQIKVVNEGDYNVTLSSIVKSIPRCDNDQELCKDLKYVITLDDGDEVAPGMVLASHSVKNMKVRIEALSSPSENTKVDNLDVDLLFKKNTK